jgi:chromosome segregation ATPase
MKNFQQNVLIIVALSLCGLCVYQWYGQTVQRNEIQTLAQSFYEKSADIQGYTNSIRTMDKQIAQLDAWVTELKGEAKTNAELIINQRRELNRLQIAAEGLTNALSEYKGAVTNMQTKLKEAYDGIEKQNQAIKDLVGQRDNLVKKYNDEAKDRNDVVNKYNELVRQVEKSQGTTAKQ